MLKTDLLKTGQSLMVPHNVEITIEVLAQYQAKVEYALLCIKKAFTINYQYHLALISKT